MVRRIALACSVLHVATAGCGGSSSAHDDASPGREDAATVDAAGDGVADAAPVADAALSVGPYNVDGPTSVSTITATVPASSSFTVTIYLPATSGPHPAVMLSSGLEQTAGGYATYGHRLASWGIIAILRDDPGLFTAASSIASDVEYVVDTWLPAENGSAASPLFGRVDTSKLALAGHSRGGQVSLLAAEAGAHVHAVFGLDPVDGTSAPEAATSIATIGVPLAFIGETTDDGANDCAPTAQNYLSLYAAASSPIVAITAIHADHTMFEDPADCTFCSLCTAGTASQPVVEAEAARYLMAFFARELLGDASVGSAFEGAGAEVDVAAGAISIESK